MISLIDRIKQSVAGNKPKTFRRKRERIGLTENAAPGAELEKKLSRITAENRALREELTKCKTENLILREQITKCKTENALPLKEHAEIKEKPKAVEPPPQLNLHKRHEDILSLLLTNSGMDERGIINALEHNPESLHAALQELKRAALIESQHLPDGSDFFSLTHAGIQYVIEKKFI